MQMQVKVGRDFFTKGLRDYANWRWAWVRELVQNGVDAGSSNISFEIVDLGDGKCRATCTNDGPPMDRETLLNKFLSLGGSTKDAGGSIGGFGMAKTVIALAHESYKIHSGDLIVSGSGGEFELTNGSYHGGVRTEVVINANASTMNAEIRRFLRYMQGRNGIRITHNGVQAPLDLNKNRARRALSFGTVHVNKSYNSLVVVRINGVPMFYDEHMTDKCVILELTKSSVETLTANRDGLRSSYQSEFTSFVRELAVNKKSALREDTITTTHYEGMKYFAWNQASKEDRVEATKAPEVEDFGLALDDAPTAGEVEWSSAAKAAPALPKRRSVVREDFFVRNELGMKIPAHFLPRASFSKANMRLVKKWGYYLLRLHQLFKKTGSFSVGFVFSDECEALFERGLEVGTVYYVNPAKVVKQASGGRSLKKRFTSKDDDMLLMLALHEFIHGAFNMAWHDEEFASRLTDCAAEVMKNRKLFRMKNFAK